jgi:hypothetical protein
MRNINREWHLNNKMPKNPSLEQRIEWHIQHSKHCKCREMPETIKILVKEKNLN